MSKFKEEQKVVKNGENCFTNGLREKKVRGVIYVLIIKLKTQKTSQLPKRQELNAENAETPVPRKPEE